MNMDYRGVLLQWSFLILIIKQVAGQNCDRNFLQTGEICYKVFRQSATKAVAESTCLSHKSALASISRSNEAYIFRYSMGRGSSTGTYWVGLHKIDDDLLWNNRVSAKGQSYVDITSTNDSSDCFIYDSNKVSPSNCSKEAQYVCQRWKASRREELLCPKGAYEDVANSECFWYTHMPLTKVGSQVVCSLKYGSLVEMRGRGFPVNVAMFLTHQMSSSDSNANPIVLWTSLVFRNGSFLLEDGAKFINQDFQLFPSGDGECVVLVIVKGKSYALNRKPCFEEAIGLCQSRTDLVRTPDWSFFFGPNRDADPVIRKGACTKAKYLFENTVTGDCYFVMTDQYYVPLSWEEAREECLRLDGDLASFHSKEELDFLRTIWIRNSVWIGLYYDFDSNQTIWADGTDVDYLNWDHDQPDHKDKRFRCGYLVHQTRKWRLDYCVMHTSFICTIPKGFKPSTPNVLTRKQLTSCPTDDSAYLFDGYCYLWSSGRFSWHRAQEFCENRGGDLVSVHSDKEVNFLIKLMFQELWRYSNSGYTRVWIGFNALGLDGAYKWSDGSPVNFINWKVGEPNNMKNQEKCANMSPLNGMWEDKNCNARLQFICKRKSDNTSDTSNLVRTTPPPVSGYCKKGWHMFDDKCFLLIGQNISMWKEGNEAAVDCNLRGGYLASIGNAREEAFLYYMMQTVKVDTWIGLHDAFQSGELYWYDNSPLYYTNWDVGEPAESSRRENCVIMSYGKLKGGRWRDIRCEQELPYICQIHRDPSILDPGPPPETICPFASGYIKQGSSCYKVFRVPASWKKAENTCSNDKGHLVSITDLEEYAVVNYLAAKSLEVNETFWIGLQSTGESYLQWTNGWHMSLSLFGGNEPQEIHREDKCFHTSMSGFWETDLCFENKTFICQIKQGEPTKPTALINGRCPPDPLSQWIDLGTLCVSIELTLYATWPEANYRCFNKGAHLVSFHSFEELKYPFLKNAAGPVFIGLTRNSGGGFMWSDGSPVNFVNWDQDEPDGGTDSCVEMREDNLKWRVVSCSSQKYYICAKEKEPIEDLDKNGEIENESSGLPIGAVITLAISVILIAVAVAVIVFYLRPWERNWDRFDISNRFSVSPNGPIRESVTSFENQFYCEDPNVDIQDINVLYAIK